MNMTNQAYFECRWVRSNSCLVINGYEIQKSANGWAVWQLSDVLAPALLRSFEKLEDAIGYATAVR